MSDKQPKKVSDKNKPVTLALGKTGHPVQCRGKDLAVYEGKPPTVLSVNATSGANHPPTAKAGEGADPIPWWHGDGLGGRTARATGVVSRLSEGCEFETTHKITRRRNGARGAQRRHEPPVGGSNPSSCT